MIYDVQNKQKPYPEKHLIVDTWQRRMTSQVNKQTSRELLTKTSVSLDIVLKKQEDYLTNAIQYVS